MRAAVLHEAGGPLVIEDVPIPEVGPHEVLVRVASCGLGLTLVWNRNGRRTDGRLPRIIGHEISGDVVTVGSAVAAFRVGDRVAVYYYLTCGYCHWCVRGREDLCDNQSGRVGRHIDGGLAEFVALPARNLCLLPPDLGYADAAVACDAIATPIHVFRRRARLQPGETVLVLGGGGGVGVHMIRTAVAFGARALATDLSDDKLAVATAAGAARAINSTKEDLHDAVMVFTQGRGADVVIDMVGIDSTLRSGIAVLGKGGRMVLVGSYDGSSTLSVRHETLGGERAVMGSSYCTRSELADALQLVAQGFIRTSITRTCDLSEADAVLRAIERKEMAGRACVVFDHP